MYWFQIEIKYIVIGYELKLCFSVFSFFYIIKHVLWYENIYFCAE